MQETKNMFSNDLPRRFVPRLKSILPSMKGKDRIQYCSLKTISLAATVVQVAVTAGGSEGRQ